MINCERAKRMIVDQLFAEIDDREEMDLNRHLAECGDCRLEEERLLRLRGDLEGEAAVIEPALKERIHAALPRGERPVRRGFLRRPVPVYAAAAACLIAAYVARSVPVPGGPDGGGTAAPARFTADPGPATFLFAGSYETAVTAGEEEPPAPETNLRREKPAIDSL